MNLSPDMVQTIVYFGLVLAGFAIKQFFPNVKLPATPSPAPAPVLPNLRDQLRDILPDLLEQLLKSRLPAMPLVQSLAQPGAVATPVAVKVSTPTHDIGVDAAGGVIVAVK